MASCYSCSINNLWRSILPSSLLHSRCAHERYRTLYLSTSFLQMQNQPLLRQFTCTKRRSVKTLT